MKINKKQKELIKIYLFLFAIVYVVINWESVSWVFNYREMTGLAYGFFNPYPESQTVAAADSALPDVTIKNPLGISIASASVIPTPTPTPVITDVASHYPATDKPNSLEIPALNLQTAVVIGESTEVSALEKDLDQGVVYYPGSVQPGQNGQIVILGHSAPPGWPKIKHDWVFSNIETLNPGDQIILYFNGHQFTYKVTSKQIIAQGQDIPVDGLQNSNELTIVSCWPPGKNYKRITVSAVLQKI